MLPVTIAIPTYRREAMLVQTLGHLVALPEPAAEILVLDQTPRHEAATDAALAALNAAGRIRWVRLPDPSIPHAMNEALVLATHPLVLFLDDDIRPEPGLVRAHADAHAAHADGLVAGRVIQPWEEGIAPPAHGFASIREGVVREFMGGNFSVRRDLALRLGGFDENFVRVAYRFEAEFAHRYRARGLTIRFEPKACLHHLKDAAGGTRTYGSHLMTWRPDHAVGAYYFGLRTRSWGELAARPLRSVATRYHLARPWRIPATLLAELGGMGWALMLYARGPRLVQDATHHPP